MNETTPGGPGAGLSMADLDHSNNGPNILAAAFITWTIALIFVLLRFYTRASIVHALGLSDWFIALSLLAAGAMCGSIAVEVKLGLGRHVWDVNFADLTAMTEAWWLALLFYVLTLALTKVSICLLYLTIFTFEWARRACYAVLTIVAITNLWGIAITLTYCIPLQAAWDYSVKATFCQPQDAWWANTGLVIATDLLIFFLPIPFVLPLKLPRRQKFVVVGIFAVGFFVCIVSLIRLAILIQSKTSTDQDFTYAPTDLTYWTVIEAHTAIVVACTMTLKPLVAKFFPDLLTPRRTAGASSSKSEEGQRVGAGGSGGPPLTIGSRPVRLSPVSPVGGERGYGAVPLGGEVGLGDVEQQLGGRGGDVGRVGGGKGDEVSPAAEQNTARAGKPLGEVVYGHAPWARSEAGSERTEDLGREMTARSMG